MKPSKALIFAGAALGFFIGSSMGVAVGGTAYNAAVFLAPLGAFIGWLLSSRNSAISEQKTELHLQSPSETNSQHTQNDGKAQLIVGQLVHSTLAIMASVWNFQIAVLNSLGLLPTFVRQPLLFLGFCIVVSMFFPPFLVLYFCAWVAASHFGLSKEDQYRVVVK